MDHAIAFSAPSWEAAFRTLDDVERIARETASSFPHPERAELGLRELMVNAVEHGNLAIGFQQKSALLANGRWMEEIERRLRSPLYAERAARLQLWRTDACLQVLVSDQGEGFDWRPFLAIGDERLAHRHGRGIATARGCGFDVLEYLGTGNQVKAVTFLAPVSSPLPD